MEEIQEITECCICTDLFTDPRMLPCIHTFCLKCLQDTALKSGQVKDDQMPCPMCRKLFTIPPEGITGLQKNFFMQRLVEIAKISKSSEQKTICEKTVCEKCSKYDGPADASLATKYCIECHESICNRCCREHERFRELQSHQLVELGSQSELIRKSDTSFCDQHAKQSMKMYCKDCKQVICVVCFAEHHQNHKCFDIDATADEFRKQMTGRLDGMSSYTKAASARKKQLLEQRKEFLLKVKKTEKEIVRKGKELKDLVDKCTKSLLDELALINHRALKEMDREKEEIDIYEASFDSFKAYCTELKSKGSAGEICRAMNDLNSRADELERMPKRNSSELLSNEFSFEASKFTKDSIKTGNIIGKIKELSTKYTEKPGSLHKIETKFKISGFALLNGQCFLISRGDKFLRIYDPSSLELIRKVTMDVLKCPSDMVSLPHLNCLCIADESILSVFCIDSQGKTLRTWKLPDRPYNLSVAPSGNIIVTCDARILEYKSNGTLFRDLHLDKDFLQMTNTAILLSRPTGNFLVCQRARNSKYNRVVELDPEGKILRSYNGTLNYPVHIAVDRDGYIFVADFDNYSIVLLNRKLAFIKTLLEPKDGIVKPFYIYLDESSRLLYVLSNSNRLDVFKMF